MEAQGVINTQEQNSAGTYQAPNTQPQHVCPNCGYCPCCGRRSFQPIPWYPTQPWYVGDLPNTPYWTVTCGTSQFTGGAGGIGAASAQPNY